MSLAYYIVVKPKGKGFDPTLDGKAIGHANQKAMTKLCKTLKVRPLEDFVSQDLIELAEFLEDEGVDAPDNLTAEEWFTAEEGLATVRALRQHLDENPKALKDSAAICADLAEYERVLEQIKKKKVQWHLAVDF
jgi:hypothetical protein